MPRFLMAVFALGLSAAPLSASPTHEERTRSDIGSLYASLLAFQAERGRYPETLEELGDAESPLKDIWGRDYQLVFVDGEPRLFTLGKDGVPGGTREDRDYFFQIPCDDERSVILYWIDAVFGIGGVVVGAVGLLIGFIIGRGFGRRSTGEGISRHP